MRIDLKAHLLKLVLIALFITGSLDRSVLP
jgi:hypothetical protein